MAATAESSHIYSPIPEETTKRVTDLLPGQLAYVFGVSILDAAFLSWVALLWYRRSVRRLMREGGPDAVTPPAEPRQPAVPTAHTSPDDQLEEFSLTEEPPESTNVRSSVIPRAGQRRVILAYAAGAAAYAAVITTLKFTAEPSPLPAVAWLVEWWTNTWPIVPTLVALLVLDRPAIVRLALRYVIGGAIAIALFTVVGQLLRGTLDTAPLTNVFWAMVSLGWAAWLPLALDRRDGLAARAGGDAARVGRDAAVRVRLDPLPRAAHSRPERCLVQVVRPEQRGALVVGNRAVRPVHARQPCRRLDRVAPPDGPGGRVRKEAIQRRSARHRLLVGRSSPPK